MRDFSELLGVCGAVLGAEFISRLCAKNDLVRFTRALAVLTVLLSALSAFLGKPWASALSKAEAEAPGETLTEYVNDETCREAESRIEGTLRGLLAAAELFPEEIRVFVDISPDGGIECTKVRAGFAYPSEAERAGALLRNVLGSEIMVEVVSDAGE